LCRNSQRPARRRRATHTGFNSAAGPRDGFGPAAGPRDGFERTVRFATGMRNIRDIIAFPRTPATPSSDANLRTLALVVADEIGIMLVYIAA